jgi:hypothetical protein
MPAEVAGVDSADFVVPAANAKVDIIEATNPLLIYAMGRLAMASVGSFIFIFITSLVISSRGLLSIVSISSSITLPRNK